MNEQVIWQLAAEGGMTALTVERLAEKTGQSPLDLKRLYPEPAFMVVAVVEQIHTQTMANAVSTSPSTQDHLTDVVMAHLDTSLANREAIRRLWDDLVTMPSALLTLRPYLMKIVRRILTTCGVDMVDLWSPLRLRAYFTLFLYVFYVWIYDESSQQEQTLVALDKGLKQLGALPW